MVSLLVAQQLLSSAYSALDYDLDSEDEELLEELQFQGMIDSRAIISSYILAMDSPGAPEVGGRNVRHLVLEWQHAIEA